MKHTKKALIMSALSMLLCLTMLVGSTFAWFTDTVTAGKNRIVAGNLDVELTHSSGNINNETVEAATNLFTQPDGTAIDWEPGVVAFENFKIENKGSLALKYQFKLAAAGYNTVKVDRENKSLADILMVAVTDEKITDRTDVTSIPADKFVKFKDFVFDNDGNDILVSDAEAAKEGATLSNTKEFTVVIYWMPTDHDDDFNLKNGKESSNGEPLYIDLGISLVATQATFEEDSFDKTYDENADYPELTESTYKVTPETIQAYLDGEHGSMSGAKLILTPGDYGVLTIGNPSKYATGDTVYTCVDGTGHSATSLSFTDLDEFKEHMNNSWHYTPYYTRTINNMTLVGQEGAKVAGISIASGHSNGNNAYDPVREKTVNGSCYYMTHKLSNLRFEGIEFTGRVNIETSSADTVIDGVTFDNCSFTTGGTDSASAQGLRYYNENNNGNVKNLTVKNCSFNTCYQGLYTSNINGITVSGCNFNTTGHNAIAVQSSVHGAVNHGAVVIENNSFNDIRDRIIRFGEVGSGTFITIKDNTATNSGNADGEVIKAVSLAEDVDYAIGGNNWGEGKIVANSQFEDIGVDEGDTGDPF